HESVIRKLSSMYPTTFSNIFMGKARVRVSRGTQGRAEGSQRLKTIGLFLAGGRMGDRGHRRLPL
ncbi:MAG: hypothetical protein ACXQTG_04685, partial [Methanoculleaceae archaeon]